MSNDTVFKVGRAATSRFSRTPSRAVLVAVGFFLVALAALVIFVVRANRPAQGDPGRLTETSPALPADIPLPSLHDVTDEWGLADLALTPAVDAMAGGSAVANVDGSGADELIVANGSVVVLTWTGSGYEQSIPFDIDDAIGVMSADVDQDGFDDLLVARAGDSDTIVWGGDWLDAATSAEHTDLPAAGQTSGLLAAELTGDDHLDVVRLGRGMDEPAPDLLWSGGVDRRFTSSELPAADRFSLAGELVDADRDGLLDIWITRDVGWAEGGDSVLSRQGDPAGPWVDVAVELGAALEVDGMGVTIADLDGDQQIDAYISDLGDNQLLVGSDRGFVERFDTGAAHIRPVGAGEGVVSSTWGTGALDINLDGVLDLVLVSGGFPAGAVRNKIDGTEVAVSEPPAVLLGHGDGSFTDVWPLLGVELDVVGRGMSVADLDDDGDDDIVIVDRRGVVRVLRNDTEGPTVTISLSSECSDQAGRVVTVLGGSGSFQRLLAPHGYASGHGARVIVGVPSGATPRVVVDGSSVIGADGLVRDGRQRSALEFECGD